MSRDTPEQTVPAYPDDWQLADACVVRSLELYPQRDRRVGMRSGMMDAARLCDLIAEDIARSGRKSKARSDMIAIAKRCADAIEYMRRTVEMPQT